MNIESLKQKLRVLKEEEATIKEERISVERQICELLADKLTDEGVHRFPGLRIVTGYSRKWDQEKLSEILDSGFPRNMFPFAVTIKHARRNNPLSMSPFEVTYREVRPVTKLFEEKHPELWAQLEQALTLTPKKPTVTVIEDEEA